MVTSCAAIGGVPRTAACLPGRFVEAPQGQGVPPSRRAGAYPHTATWQTGLGKVGTAGLGEALSPTGLRLLGETTGHKECPQPRLGRAVGSRGGSWTARSS